MTHNIYDQIITKFDALNIDYRQVDHVAEGSCEAISKIRGNALEQAAKALVLTYKVEGSYQFCLCILAGDKKVDFKKVQAAVGKKVKMASVDQVMELTGCGIGAVPPFPTIQAIPTLVDPSLLLNEEIVFNAGCLDKSIFMHVDDYKSFFDFDTVQIVV
ncbi:hypothetical protein J8M21_13370 [Pseudoalteromonas luteoviolacea]|uniref:YbaK/EbsC family protein n=1 Tax=Pseudoalteromonas luteoviolacea TaxID=43657 RepID=UPI001B39E191|nr:YbaK/EbsC family protein [Pseudoalteromonas luteoviolacea]MBQ4878197.1 hypothetical protein [Pseudoalteromonas luteoviolacea]MBQ4907352.1 hypothetical protein [Pseudoalteromonas luteoviolacea]